MATGCANVERKLGRGLNNTWEIVRGGEFRRTMEQTALFDSPDTAYGAGFFTGLNRTLARTGVGIPQFVRKICHEIDSFEVPLLTCSRE